MKFLYLAKGIDIYTLFSGIFALLCLASHTRERTGVRDGEAGHRIESGTWVGQRPDLDRDESPAVWPMRAVSERARYHLTESLAFFVIVPNANYLPGLGNVQSPAKVSNFPFHKIMNSAITLGDDIRGYAIIFFFIPFDEIMLSAFGFFVGFKDKEWFSGILRRMLARFLKFFLDITRRNRLR